MHALHGRTADEVWRAAAAMFTENGAAREQAGRGGGTLELLHTGISIAEPRQRWVFSRTPAMNPAFALVEVIWILAGRQDAALPTFWNPVLPRFSGYAARLHGAYGYRLRSHFGLDQLDRVYRVLDAAPESRQAVLQIWDSRTDLPGEDGAPASADIPCNVIAFPKVRDGRLEWLQVLRSNDLFLGLPHNVVQFTSLQEVVAGWLDLEVGTYSHVSDSLHVYDRDVNAVRASIQPVSAPDSPDTLALDRPNSERVVMNVAARLDVLAAPALSETEFRTVAFGRDSPPGYENMLLLAAADSARRRGWTESVVACMEKCTNPALVTLWNRWMERVEQPASDTRGAE